MIIARKYFYGGYKNIENLCSSRPVRILRSVTRYYRLPELAMAVSGMDGRQLFDLLYEVNIVS